MRRLRSSGALTTTALRGGLGGFGGAFGRLGGFRVALIRKMGQPRTCTAMVQYQLITDVGCEIGHDVTAKID